MSHPLQRAQIGHAVDAAGVALLTDDQDGQDRGDGLGDDGEVGAADAALEHRRADDEGEDAGTRMIAQIVKVRLWNGCQNNGSAVI